MMKHKMIAALAIAALAAASIGTNAFAASEERTAYTVTMKDDGGNGREIPQSELKTDEHGNKYYETEDGVTITIVDAESDGNTSMKLQQKTDENGEHYYELEDGSRIRVTRSNSSAE